MDQRALVTGASGLLGRQVLRRFELEGFEVTGTGFSRASPPKILKCDIQNEDEVTKLFEQVKPHVVVHCAADRQPDSCTKDPEAARRLNVTATETLAKAASSCGAFLIYISTDYVFPGVQGEAPYKALDATKPPNIYGQTKADGEQAVLETISSPVGGSAGGSAGAVVLRVPVLYGPTEPRDNNQESAVNVLMDALWKAQKEKVKMDDWAIRYPTNTEDVGRVCVDIAKLYTSRPHQDSHSGTHSGTRSDTLPRILQFSSEDRITKYEITQKFADIMGLSMDGIVADKDGGKPAPDGTLRPYDCHLDTSELKKLGVDVSTVDFVAWWRRWVGAFRH